jgi:hypothetical protein
MQLERYLIIFSPDFIDIKNSNFEIKFISFQIYLKINKNNQLLIIIIRGIL